MAKKDVALQVLRAGRNGGEFKTRKRNLSANEIREIVRMYYDGESSRALGSLFKVSHTTVCRLAKGELAPDVTLPWIEELAAKKSAASPAGEKDEPEEI